MSRTHVQAPTKVIFLCGGQCSSINTSQPLSLRDAFLKILINPAVSGCLIVQAEEITQSMNFFDFYDDMLQFETDLARITELVLLFCESEGSLAELGAFAATREIAARLLVVVRDRHWTAQSFIKYGPLRSLEKNFGTAAVYVIDDRDIGMRGDSAKYVNVNILKERLQSPLRQRLAQARESTTLDKSRSGHVIKLIVGLCQEYGALTADEIGNCLPNFGCGRTSREIAAYLMCAEAMKWVAQRRKGSETYFVACNLDSDAASLVFIKDPAMPVGMRIKARRRLFIREHWKKVDIARARSIDEVFTGLRV